MTTNQTPFESKMLQEVRRWRREAYQMRQTQRPEERAKRLNELLEEAGLSLGHGTSRQRERRVLENDD